jgi:hypothetical protein
MTPKPAGQHHSPARPLITDKRPGKVVDSARF